MPEVALPEAVAPRRSRPPRGLLLARLDDRRLCELVAGGDDKAFEVLYDRHHRPLLAFCRHTLSRREEGEDALQQTFLRAHQALRAGRVPDDLRPWLFTIARNRCRTLLAARRDRGEVPTDAAAEPSVAGLAAEVAQREDLRTLLADLADLAEEQRTALVLSEIGDMRHHQIAAVLGVDVPKVRQLVYQARTNLLAQREAREAPCASIQQQLATARGGVLRRGPLRRHVKLCDPCRTFAAAMTQQRAALGLILPVVPSAGAKAGLLGVVGGGGGAAKLGAAGSVGSVAASMTAAKIIVAITIAGLGAGGAAAIAEPEEGRPPVTAPIKRSAAVAPRPPAPKPAVVTTPTAAAAIVERSSHRPRRIARHRRALRRARRAARRRAAVRRQAARRRAATRIVRRQATVRRAQKADATTTAKPTAKPAPTRPTTRKERRAQSNPPSETTTIPTTPSRRERRERRRANDPEPPTPATSAPAPEQTAPDPPPRRRDRPSEAPDPIP